MQVCLGLSSDGDSEFENYKNGLHGMGEFAMNGAWECAWRPTRRERTLNEFCDLDATPLGIRKAGFREFAEVL